MNLNELWSGTDYAYYSWKGRGEVYRSTALRVKVIRAYKRQVQDNERLSGFAEVMYCDRETGEPETYPENYYDLNLRGQHKTGEVRARDIAMRWEEYEELHAQYVARQRKEEQERRERRERQEAERLEREELARKEREERERLEKLKLQRIKDFLASHFISEDWISTVGTDYIYISRAAIEKELEGLDIYVINE